MQQSIIRLIIFYAISVYYNILVLFAILIRVFKKRSFKLTHVKERDLPPKCLIDPENGTHSFIHVNGVKLHYVEAGDRSKPMMLFVHGFPEFWYSWRHQIKEFAKDYWCVAIDMRGYGDSDKPEKLSAYSMGQLVEDLHQLIINLDHKGCILVGHDWGGAICWVFLDQYPHLVDKYIMLNAPHFKVYRKLYATNKTQRKMSWYISFFQTPYLPEFTLRLEDLIGFDKMLSKYCSPDEIEAFKYTFGKPGALTPPLNYYRNIPFNTIERNNVLDETHPPGLFIFGANDEYLVSDMVDMTVEITPNLTSKLVLNVGHFIQQEIPSEVNQMMREFLEK